MVIKPLSPGIESCVSDACTELEHMGFSVVSNANKLCGHKPFTECLLIHASKPVRAALAIFPMSPDFQVAEATLTIEYDQTSLANGAYDNTDIRHTVYTHLGGLIEFDAVQFVKNALLGFDEERSDAEAAAAEVLTRIQSARL